MVKSSWGRGVLLAAAAVTLALLPLSASGGAFRASNGKIVFTRGGKVYVSASASDVGGAVNIATGANPAVSPDGTKVAYDTGGQIRVVNIDGTGDAALTGAAGSEPAWGSAGGKVFFVTLTGALAWVPSGGGSATVFTNAPATGNIDPSASPDGNVVAFANNSTGTYQIYTTNSDGTSGSATRFTNDSSNDTSPTWSPNGSPIAYVSDRTGTKQLWSANFPFSGEQRLTNDSHNDTDPAFSPDGRLVLFASDATGLQSLVYATKQASAIANSVAGDAGPDWQDAPPINTSAPSITGSPFPGQTLTASTGTWSGFPAQNGYTYQWQRTPTGTSNWVDIAGATNPTYVVQAGDSGFDLRVEVTASNVAGQSLPAPSPPAGATLGAPVNLTRPTFTGNYTANLGGFVSATAGTWSGLSPITYKFQWLRCYGQTDGHCEPIPGAISSFYTPNGDDIGTQLNVAVVATNSVGSGVAYSDATPYILGDPPHNHVSPTITGGIEVGNTLTATPGIWYGPTPLTFTYQWRICKPDGSDCNSIPGATSTSYTLQPSDYGSTIRIMVRARNGAGYGYGVSNHTLPILHRTIFGPASSSAPTLAGPARVGAVLIGSGGTWTGEAPIKLAYAWQRCDAVGSSCVTISRATKTTYVVQKKDIGSTIRLQVTATNVVNHAVATSQPTDAISAGQPREKGRKIVGKPGQTVIAGTTRDDLIYAGPGNVTIYGMGGYDKIHAGRGNDVVYLGTGGSSHVWGDAGSLTVYAANGEQDTIDCGTGPSRVYVDAFDVTRRCRVVTITGSAPSTPTTPTTTARTTTGRTTTGATTTGATTTGTTTTYGTTTTTPQNGQ